MISSDALRGEVVVTPPVEIDVASGATFARQIAQACALRPDRVVIDFQAVTFCDSTAIRVLMSALAARERRACVLVVRNPSGQLRRLAQVLHVAEALGIPRQRGSRGQAPPVTLRQSS